MSLQWKATPLSKILKPVLRSEKVDPAKEYRLLGIRLDGAGPFLREIKVGSQISANYLSKVKTGDFIYSRLFAWRGAFGVIDDALNECYVSNEFPTYDPISNEIDTQFLKLWFRLSTTISKVESDCSGSTPLTRNRFKEEFFLNLEIALPPPDEQRRIVARIEELASRIEEARELRRRAMEETEALMKASLASIFEEKINTGEFVHRPLSQIAEIARGKFSHRPRNEPRFYGGDIPFIQIGDISNSGSRYIVHYSQTLNQEGFAISRMFQKGTVVIAITGATIGATGILTFDSCFPDSIVGIIAKEDIIRPEFIYWGLEYAKKSALAEATQTTQPNINLKNLEKLLIPTPSYSQQNQIVMYLDALQSKLEALRRHQAETAAALEALLPAVLERAFRGEL